MRRTVIVALIGSIFTGFLIMITLGASGALAFNLKQAVGEALGGVVGITEVTVNSLLVATRGKGSTGGN